MIVNQWNKELLESGIVRFKVIKQDLVYCVYDYTNNENVFETVEIPFMNCFVMGLKLGRSYN